MSAGTVHFKASLLMSGGFLLCTILSWNIQLLPLVGGAVTGMYLTPDLDVDNGFYTDQLIRKYIGAWAEWIWKQYWYPYRRSLKHGGPLSHFPPLGTLGRVAYVYITLIALPCLLLYFIYRLDGYGWDVWGELIWWWNWIFSHWKFILGLITTDTIHYFLDILTTDHKKAI